MLQSESAVQYKGLVCVCGNCSLRPLYINQTLIYSFATLYRNCLFSGIYPIDWKVMNAILSSTNKNKSAPINCLATPLLPRSTKQPIRSNCLVTQTSRSEEMGRCRATGETPGANHPRPYPFQWCPKCLWLEKTATNRFAVNTIVMGMYVRK